MAKAALAVATLVLATGAAPRARATADRLVIHSDSSCPSAEAVRQALIGLRPGEDWPSSTVTVASTPDALVLELVPHPTRQRRIAVTPDCDARAALVALVVATWMDDLPAEAVGVPHLTAPAVASASPPTPPSAPARRRELGVGLLAATVGGTAPGVAAELVWLWRDGALGWQASLTVPAARELTVGGGTTRWTRAVASLALHARYPAKRFFVAANAGASAAYTRAWGVRYAANQTDQSLVVGLLGSVRAGVPWARFRIWTDLGATWWLGQQSVEVEDAAGGVATAALPGWDLQWTIGVSYAF